MNASYLSRLFKAKCGKTFSKYLIEYRLEKSRELLEKTILKVSDIAAHVGYNDVSHYIQSFRKVYGVTPEQYRNSWKSRKSKAAGQGGRESPRGKVKGFAVLQVQNGRPCFYGLKGRPGTRALGKTRGRKHAEAGKITKNLQKIEKELDDFVGRRL